MTQKCLDSFIKGPQGHTLNPIDTTVTSDLQSPVGHDVRISHRKVSFLCDKIKTGENTLEILNDK